MPNMPDSLLSNPVINSQQINDNSEGDENLALTLSKIASSSAQTATEMQEDESSAMYVNSVANVEQLKTTTQIRMIQHPDAANKIAEDYRNASDIVVKNSYVNKKDRSKLNQYSDSLLNSVDLQAAEATAKQTRLQASIEHYTNWPDQLKSYYQALLTNPEMADSLKKSMVNTLKGLASIEAITPLQAANGVKSMSDMVDVANDHHSVYGDEEATATHLHETLSHPLNYDNPHNTNLPINESTKWLIDHYNNDKSFQGVIADISNRKLPDPAVFDSLTPLERNHAILSISGVRVADGLINSGEPFPVIEKTFKDLNETNRILNYKERATRNSLNVYIQELKNGNYLSVIGKTPAGGSIIHSYIDKNAAINNMQLSDEKKKDLLDKNKNEMISSMVSYGEAHHIPQEYIKPIPENDMAIANNSFKLDQDPSEVLNLLDNYGKINKIYFSDSLSKPHQKIMMEALSYSDKTIKPQSKIDFVTANQEGRDYSMIDFSKNKINNEILSARIYSNFKEQLNFFENQYDRKDSMQLQNGMVQSTLRYAKFLAIKNQDFSMNHWKDYIDQASDIYMKSFKVISGSNYIVNDAQLNGQYTKSDLDILSWYAINNAQNYLKEGKDQSMFLLAMDRNPLKMIISSTNHLQAIDSNGTVYYSQPLTQNLIGHARVEFSKSKENIKNESLGRKLLTQEIS